MVFHLILVLGFGIKLGDLRFQFEVSLGYVSGPVVFDVRFRLSLGLRLRLGLGMVFGARV